jgi:hypothetical protein
MFKAIGNAEQAQLSLQLVVVSSLLLVEAFELLNVLTSLVELLSVLGHSFVYSGDKPIGHGTDGSIEYWIKGEDCLS